LFFGFLAAQIVGFTARMVRDPKKLESAVRVPTLGILPIAFEQDQSKATKDNPYMLAYAAPTAVPVEALRSLRTAVLFALSETPRNKVVLITSAVPGQGKSFIAANLSYLFATGGKRVLLIDADVRRSTIGRYVKEPRPVVGLSAVLQDGHDADALILRNVYPQLDVLPAGQHVKNPGDLFSRSALADLVNLYSGQYDLVLIDSPPILPVNDAANMASMADITLFVARQNLVTLAEVEESLVLLQRAGKKADGLVFNGFVPSRLRYGYGYKYSYYRYGYKYKKYGGYKYENPYQ
jgi:tyrosine-protein kinase Etk/Wzc